MKTIWKFELQVGDAVTIEMPKGAEILHMDAGIEGRSLMVWALVDPKAPIEPRQFAVRGTGHVVEDDLTYIATAVALHGVLVWHLFER